MTPDERAKQLAIDLSTFISFSERKEEYPPILRRIKNEFDSIRNEALDEAALVVEHEESLEMELDDIADAVRSLKSTAKKGEVG